MKVILRQPRREIEVEGVSKVADLFKQLDLVPESYLVIRDGELLTIDMNNQFETIANHGLNVVQYASDLPEHDELPG